MLGRMCSAVQEAVDGIGHQLGRVASLDLAAVAVRSRSGSSRCGSTRSRPSACAGPCPGGRTACGACGACATQRDGAALAREHPEEREEVLERLGHPEPAVGEQAVVGEADADRGGEPAAGRGTRPSAVQEKCQGAVSAPQWMAREVARRSPSRTACRSRSGSRLLLARDAHNERSTRPSAAMSQFCNTYGVPVKVAPQRPGGPRCARGPGCPPPPGRRTAAGRPRRGSPTGTGGPSGWA